MAIYEITDTQLKRLEESCRLKHNPSAADNIIFQRFSRSRQNVMQRTIDTITYCITKCTDSSARK